MLDVSVHSQAAIEANEISADGLISICCVRDGWNTPPKIDGARFGGLVLSLGFDDIPWTRWDGWVGPEPAHLNAALAFARTLRSNGKTRLAIHCFEGRSRSAAIALAIEADQLGSGQEDEAVRRLLAKDRDGRFKFNPRLVRFADAALGRNGALEGALERLCPAYPSWRAYWNAKADKPEAA